MQAFPAESINDDDDDAGISIIVMRARIRIVA
jgi:hypothetical protein